MARIYVTASDYLSWSGETATVDQLTLLRASRAVDDALVGVIYDVDSDQMPVDSDILAAVKEACLWQVAALVEASKLARGEVSAPLTSAKIGTSAYTYAMPQAAMRISLPDDGSLCPEGRAALARASLMRKVIVHG